MKSLAGALSLMTAVSASPAPDNWCRIGQIVMIPDGREGSVTSIDGDICRVLVYGEAYVSLWAYYVIDPAAQRFGH